MDELVNEKMICTWRVTRGIPSGLHIWFDPEVESVRLYRIPTSEQRSFDPVDAATVDAGVGPGYLDKVASVSACETEADAVSYDDTELPF